MRKLGYIIITFILLSCSEKKVKQIPLIEGMVTNFDQTEILLFNDNASTIALDTITVNPEGVFSVAKQAINEPGFYYLQFGSAGKINFFLKPSDYINLSVDANNLLGSCKSNNSKFLTAFWDLEKNTLKFNEDISAISNKFSKIKTQNDNDSIYEQLYLKKNKLINLYKTKSKKIAKTINSPVIDFIMLNQKIGNISMFDLQNDLQLFLDNAEKLSENEELKSLFEKYDNALIQAYTVIRSEERYHKGGMFPAIRARTNWNEELTVKQTKGKCIHIILWSGNDLLDESKLKLTKQMMYRYNSKGLKTIMIAYIKNKKEWLSNIKKHKLPYYHLIDTNAVESLDLVEMGIRSLPCNFLVDSTGTILNRDIWGKELELNINSNIKK